MSQQSLQYNTEDRRKLQAFLAQCPAKEEEVAVQENWVRIESLLSAEHRMALFGDKETGQKASYPAQAICYRLADDTAHTATYGTLVPPEARIEYVKRSERSASASGEGKPGGSGESGMGGPDDEDVPMYIPAVSGG